MKRSAFKMQLKPGCEAEYQKRHDEIWPELSRLLSEAGISDYSIFLDPDTLTLFAVQKLSPDHTVANLPQHPLIQKWWATLVDLMETHPDHSPVCTELVEVFHAD